MAEDPNETARQAFGEGPGMLPPSPAHASAAPATRSAGALAEWGTRAAAFVLDGLLLFGVTVLVGIVAAMLVGTSDGPTVKAIVYAICIPLGFLYAPLLMMRHGSANGQTIGKQMLDIRVVRTNGEPVTFWNAFLRQVIGQQLLMTITLYVYALFDYLWPLRDPRNQALHDKIASTLVVRTKEPTILLSQPVDEELAPPSPRRVDEAPVHGWLPPSTPGG